MVLFGATTFFQPNRRSPVPDLPRTEALCSNHDQSAARGRVAFEAADSGLLSPELAAGIRRVRGVRRIGVRLGNWLTVEQGKRLLGNVERESLRGIRNYAILAMLIGCGLRRGELVALRVDSIQSREERWVIADLLGKAGHIRTIPIPAWVRTGVEKWMHASGITNGALFRSIDKRGRVWGTGMTPKVLWEIVKADAARADIPKLAPHHLRRYAEFRTMPNRQRCGHARKALDTVRCGIVLAMPVLRVGRDDPIRLDCAVPRTIEHFAKPGR
jgi:integrase